MGEKLTQKEIIALKNMLNGLHFREFDKGEILSSRPLVEYYQRPYKERQKEKEAQLKAKNRSWWERFIYGDDN